jgi:ketosteroid isomerase-like protein
MPDAGFPVAIGRAAIVQRMSDKFAMTSDIEWSSDDPVMLVEVGDYVIVHQTSRTSSTLVDGAQHVTDARATYVLHRGDDGNWRVVIDHGSSL